MTDHTFNFTTEETFERAIVDAVRNGRWDEVEEIAKLRGRLHELLTELRPMLDPFVDPDARREMRAEEELAVLRVEWNELKPRIPANPDLDAIEQSVLRDTLRVAHKARRLGESSVMTDSVRPRVRELEADVRHTLELDPRCPYGNDDCPHPDKPLGEGWHSKCLLQRADVSDAAKREEATRQYAIARLYVVEAPNARQAFDEFGERARPDAEYQSNAFPITPEMADNPDWSISFITYGQDDISPIPADEEEQR